MALNWDITEVVNVTELCWQENLNPDRKENEKYELNPITAALINIGMFTGIPKLTQKNYKELAMRCVELEMIGIAMVPYNQATGEVGNRESDLRNPTEEEVQLHIGLKTNVSPKDGKKWGHEIRRLIRERALEYLRHQRSKHDEDQQQELSGG